MSSFQLGSRVLRLGFADVWVLAILVYSTPLGSAVKNSEVAKIGEVWELSSSPGSKGKIQSLGTNRLSLLDRYYRIFVVSKSSFDLMWSKSKNPEEFFASPTIWQRLTILADDD